MIYAYIVISAALIPILNNFFDILGQTYSWWLTPALMVLFFLGFLIIQFGIFVLMILFTDTKKEVPNSSKFFRFLVKNCLSIIIFLARVKINHSGEEKLPTEGRMLVVCNHQHDFDPIIMFSVFPDAELAFIGKKEIYTEMRFISKAMHRLQSLPIDRENDREAAKTIIKAIRTITDDRASIALFPEGYVSKTCEILPFRNGSLKVAIKAKVPVVVCVINNTQEIPKKMFRKKSEVEFHLVDVITPEQYEGMNTQELGEIIHSKMSKKLMGIRNK